MRFGVGKTNQLSDKNEKWWRDVDTEARVRVLGLKNRVDMINRRDSENIR